VHLGLSGPRAVLTLYVAAVSLGAVAVMLTRLEPLAANLAFGGLLAAGLGVLVALERVEPRLGGDPLIVLVPGEGGFAPALEAVSGLSRNVVVLVAAGRAARLDVVEAGAGVAEDPPAVRALLARGLGEAWWDEWPALSPALRLHGAVAVVNGAAPAADPAGEPAPALAAARKARLVVYGPGRPDGNIQAVLESPGVGEALRAAAGRSLWTADGPARVGEALSAATPAGVRAALQRRLLHEAAGRAKTTAPAA
jgi:hypothetical protein